MHRGLPPWRGNPPFAGGGCARRREALTPRQKRNNLPFVGGGAEFSTFSRGWAPPARFWRLLETRPLLPSGDLGRLLFHCLSGCGLKILWMLWTIFHCYPWVDFLQKKETNFAYILGHIAMKKGNKYFQKFWEPRKKTGLLGIINYEPERKKHSKAGWRSSPPAKSGKFLLLRGVGASRRRHPPQKEDYSSFCGGPPCMGGGVQFP